MWRSGWVLVPMADLPLIIDNVNEADVEPWDYPGSDFRMARSKATT